MEFDLKGLTPDVRKLSDMKNVLYDQEWAKTRPEGHPDLDLYFMYRKIKQENGLVHNITITPANMLGSEFAKTKGHVHIGNFQEIYTVLEGRAIYLVQKGDGEKIEDVYAVKAEKGESAIIPAGYGHITINPSETETLKTGDWTSENCKSDYSLFEKLQGACYYYVKGPASGPKGYPGFGEGTWIKNEHYKSVPELRFEEALKSVPKDLNFLK